MWDPILFHGEPLGRVRGVCVPAVGHSQLQVWADNGFFNVWFFRTASVGKMLSAADAAALFDPAAGVLRWQRAEYRMHGACGPGDEVYTLPAVTEHPSGDRLVPDPDTDSLLVLDAAGTVRQTIANYRPASEPWALATFITRDLSVLLVADPHAVRLFKYFVTKGAEQPRWKAGGGSTEQKLLHRAILDHPDEDTPRLMYADWLDENGDPARAEFIRLQCRHAERQAHGPVPTEDPDFLRMYELQGQMAARWLAELPPIHGIRWDGFRRGFPGVRVTSPVTLVRFARKVWAAAPVEAVTIDGLRGPNAAALADSPWLRRIRRLALERYYHVRDGGEPLRALFHSPGVSGLRSIRLTSCYVPGEGMRAILTSPHLTGLEWLHANYGAVTDDVAGAMLTAPALGKLLGGPFRGNGLAAGVKERLKARFRFA